MTDAKPIGQKITAFVAAIEVMPDFTWGAHAATINEFLYYDKFKSRSDYATAFRQALHVGYDAVWCLMIGISRMVTETVAVKVEEERFVTSDFHHGQGTWML